MMIAPYMLRDQAGLAAAIAEGLSNDAVRDSRCSHPCGEYETGIEKERTKKGKKSARRGKAKCWYGSGGHVTVATTSIK